MMVIGYKVIDYGQNRGFFLHYSWGKNLYVASTTVKSKEEMSALMVVLGCLAAHRVYASQGLTPEIVLKAIGFDVSPPATIHV